MDTLQGVWLDHSAVDLERGLLQGLGSLSVSSTRALLKGVGESTFDEFVGRGQSLCVSDLCSFLEGAAKNLSGLMLQQTMLEQEAFRISVDAPGHMESMNRTISRSKQLFEKCAHADAYLLHISCV